MLSALLLAFLGAPPVCEAEVHFTWPSSAFVGVRDGSLAMRTFAWVRAGGDGFVIELGGKDVVLVGRRAGTPAVDDITGWTKEQSEVLLPPSQGGVLLTASGGGLGCVVTKKGADLGGPIAADVVIDARTKWHFELRDRSMKRLLISF